MIKLGMSICLGLMAGTLFTFGIALWAMPKFAQQENVDVQKIAKGPVLKPEDICTAQDQIGSGMAHGHTRRDVSPDLPIPSVSHLVFPDVMDGYNIQIILQNFTFKPASINKEARSNQGHAHLYVNGEKVARLYSDWFHMPGSFLSEGVNIVTVTLNANDHTEWSIDGQPISSSVRVVKSVH